MKIYGWIEKIAYLSTYSTIKGIKDNKKLEEEPMQPSSGDSAVGVITSNLMAANMVYASYKRSILVSLSKI